MHEVDPHGYTIVADLLLDGSGAPPMEQPAVTIGGGRIRSIEQRQPNWRAPQHTVHDFSGCTIVPGLIDTHCHLALDSTLDVDASIAFAQQGPDEEILATMLRNARQAFAAGVTTLRDCGSPRTLGVRFREEALESHEPLPRLFVSGRPITTRLGHCHWMGICAESADELREAVTTLADDGVDFVKIMATGGMMTSTSDPYSAQYTADQLGVVVRAARERSKSVAAHALSAEGVRAAVAAGVSTIEHCVTTTSARQDYDPALNARIVEAGITVGVTAHNPLRTLLGAGDLAGIRQRLTPHRELYTAGVVLTVHSDAGTMGTSFDRFAESIEIFKIGMEISVSEALRAATSTAARALGIENETGRLIPGLAADLLVLEGDLGLDVRVLRRVVRVARAGDLRPVTSTPVSQSEEVAV